MNRGESCPWWGHSAGFQLPVKVSGGTKMFILPKGLFSSQKTWGPVGASGCRGVTGGHGGLPVAQGVLQRAWAREKNRAGGKTAGAALQGAAFNRTNKCRDVGSSLR